MNAKTISCTCSHPQQDAIHGKNQRVANSTTKSVPADKVVVRCTVCNKETTVNK